MTPTTDTAFRVYLVSPAVWQPIQTTAFMGLPPNMKAFATEVLELAHTRHVGVPAELVAQLVPHLLTPRFHEQAANPWFPCFKRLFAEVQGSSQSNSAPVGLLVAAQPTWFVLQIALPLCIRVIQTLGVTYLFCEEFVETGVEPHLYTAYRDKFAKQLTELASRTDDTLFWAERALTLATLSRHRHPHATLYGSPVRGPELALLLRLRADLNTNPNLPRRLKQIASRQARRRTRQFREGGFEGIHLTKRPEDLDEILLSEFINPDVVLTDRLLNTGFFALERSPRRENLREVHIVGMLPGSLAQTLVGFLVKACWFEALVTFGHLLRQAGLGDSTFTWIEGDPAGRLFASSFSLSQLPSYEQLGQAPLGELWRREFLTALGWVPFFLNPTERTFPAEPHPAGPKDPDLHWASTVWLQLRNANDTHSQLPNFDQFAHTHLMAFLPISGEATTLTAHFPSYVQAFKLGSSPAYHLSITGVPRNYPKNHTWSFLSHSQNTHLFQEQPPENERRIASQLIQVWTHQFLGEIWRD